MTLRIVHVVRQYTPSVGGLEAVVARLAHEQAHRLGHAVRIVTLDRLFSAPWERLPAHETIDGIEVRRLPWRGSSRYPLCPQVVGHLDDADLVHVHAVDFFFDWLSATRWLHRKPMIASTHGGFFHTTYASALKRLWFHTITRVSSRGYRRIVATSDNDGAVFRTIAGRRVLVIENGAEIDRFRDAAHRDVVPVILFFGRWSANKGLPELIELVARLRASDDRWTSIIAGRPYDLSIADLQAAIAAHSLEDAIELHASPDDDALRVLMSRASYFACLSRHEGFGIAAIEAMSAGLLPLLSDIPPFRKIVDASGIGTLLPVGGDAGDAADRVLGFHRASVVDAREQAIAFAQRYEWSAVADRYDEVCRDTVAGAKPAKQVAASPS